MGKIPEVQAQAEHRLVFFPSIKGPSANPIAMEITPEAAPLLPTPGWAEPRSFPAC